MITAIIAYVVIGIVTTLVLVALADPGDTTGGPFWIMAWPIAWAILLVMTVCLVCDKIRGKA